MRWPEDVRDMEGTSVPRLLELSQAIIFHQAKGNNNQPTESDIRRYMATKKYGDIMFAEVSEKLYEIEKVYGVCLNLYTWCEERNKPCLSYLGRNREIPVLNINQRREKYYCINNNRWLVPSGLRSDVSWLDPANKDINIGVTGYGWLLPDTPEGVHQAWLLVGTEVTWSIDGSRLVFL